MLMDHWNMRSKPALTEPKRKQMHEVVLVQTCVCVCVTTQVTLSHECLGEGGAVPELQ